MSGGDKSRCCGDDENFSILNVNWKCLNYAGYDQSQASLRSRSDDDQLREASTSICVQTYKGGSASSLKFTTDGSPALQKKSYWNLIFVVFYTLQKVVIPVIMPLSDAHNYMKC